MGRIFLIFKGYQFQVKYEREKAGKYLIKGVIKLQLRPLRKGLIPATVGEVLFRQITVCSLDGFEFHHFNPANS